MIPGISHYLHHLVGLLRPLIEQDSLVVMVTPYQSKVIKDQVVQSRKPPLIRAVVPAKALRFLDFMVQSYRRPMQKSIKKRMESTHRCIYFVWDFTPKPDGGKPSVRPKN